MGCVIFMQIFEIEPLFEGQVHERFQFKFKFEGNDYRGFVEEGDIRWFNPPPHEFLEEKRMDIIESKVQELMSDYLQ